jgi:xanthine dehydrogenase accessory factor
MPDKIRTHDPEPDLFEEIVRLRASGEPAALATVVGTRGSTPGKETMRLLVTARGRVMGTVGGGCVEADVVDAALEVIAADAPRRLTFRLTESATGESGLMCGGELDVFVEPITAPHLFLFGAGHISKDLCAIAARAGFRVTVTDDRVTFANEERFPSAARVVAAPSFAGCFAQLSVGPSACCVVVTRGHAMDLECLDFALHTPAAYVGLIGSRVKIRNILGRLARAGRLDDVDLSRLHAPIGLDLGGGSHGEIAVAIVAELVAHRRGRLAGQRLKRMTIEEMLAARDRAAGPREPDAGATPARPLGGERRGTTS